MIGLEAALRRSSTPQQTKRSHHDSRDCTDQSFCPRFGSRQRRDAANWLAAEDCNTAEKIFEFSCVQPIALMLYNNVEFMGGPSDVLIRKHRSSLKKKYATLEDAASAFIDYMIAFERDSYRVFPPTR